MKHSSDNSIFNHIDIRTGRPCLHWDNAKWQLFFSRLKLHIQPAPNAECNLPFPGIRLKSGEDYYGNTNYQYYCRYINDVLTTIRHGKDDYCYFIYQIADLCRYEPELKTELCGGRELSPYIRVWLDGGLVHNCIK